MNVPRRETEKEHVLPSIDEHRHRVLELNIVGIEVIQAVQRFTFPDPNAGAAAAAGLVAGGYGNNSVPLVAHKRTLARVYVDSGPTDNVPVKGTMTLSSLDGSWGPASVDVGPPVNLGGATARELANLDRGDLRNSLNFMLPVPLLAGPIRLDAEIDVDDPLYGSSPVTHSESVEFQERKLPKTLIPMLVMNGEAGMILQMADYEAALDHVRAAFPAPDDNFDHLPPLDGGEWVYNEDDLTTQDGTNGLMMQLENIVSGFDTSASIVTAELVHPREPIWGALDGLSVGYIVWFTYEASPYETAGPFAHELGHSFGLHHAGEDPRIPLVTDDYGVDLSSMTLMPPRSSELMNAMSGYPWWMSTATWGILFDAFAV
jgi:hypothetical protein